MESTNVVSENESVISKIKKFFEIPTQPVNTDNTFSANSMYLISNYSTNRISLNDEDRLRLFYDEMYKFIRGKAEMKFKTCTYDVPEDLLAYLPEILHHLESLGFSVIDMGKDNSAFDGSIGISWKFYHASKTTEVVTADNN